MPYDPMVTHARVHHVPHVPKCMSYHGALVITRTAYCLWGCQCVCHFDCVPIYIFGFHHKQCASPLSCSVALMSL